MNSSANDTNLLNRSQLATKLGVSERTISTWQADEIIPAIKIRGVVRFDYANVLAAMKRRETKAREIRS